MMLIFQKELGPLVSSSALVYTRQSGQPVLVLRRLAAPAALKDIIESLGVPHCEIGSVSSLKTDSLLPLDSLGEDGDVVEVAGTRPRPLVAPRFLCDGHLGKLALLLRIMGFDTAWDDSWAEPAVARRGINENRTVLSRSRSLLKRAAMDDAMLVRSDGPDAQAAEVLDRFRLRGRVRLFGRCTRCNGVLRAAARAEVADRIPPRTAKWLDNYYLCGNCDHLFWEGTHVTALRNRVEGILLRRAETERPERS
jgi:hypothetical protein